MIPWYCLPSFSRKTVVLAAALLAFCSRAHSRLAPPNSAEWRRAACPDITGDITVQEFQLYPENLDFDFSRCLVFFGSLFNASVAVYDPFKKQTVETLTFDNITHNPVYHLGGVAVNPITRQLSIVVDVGAAFNTAGQDISGTNWFIKYDYDAKKVLSQVNLTATTQGAYGGPQDVEHDKEGNAYVVFTWPSAILRIENGTNASEWYPPQTKNHTIQGFGGLAALGDVLLTNDNTNGQIVRFNMKDEKGTPVVVPHSPNTTIGGSDAIYLPPRYNGTVLLVAEDATGISVLQSKDARWTEASYLGLVPNTGPSGSSVTAPVQIGNSLYMNLEFFADPAVTPWGSGNRTSFPLLDITAQVDKLVEQGSLHCSTKP